MGRLHWNIHCKHDICICACKHSGSFPVANMSEEYNIFDLSTVWLQCDPGPPFELEYSLPRWVLWKELSVLAVQWHALCFGLFASIIAPFRGVFASDFKRAFKIKDFGYSIPGHGGFTDRMDC